MCCFVFFCNLNLSFQPLLAVTSLEKNLLLAWNLSMCYQHFFPCYQLLSYAAFQILSFFFIFDRLMTCLIIDLFGLNFMETCDFLVEYLYVYRNLNILLLV